MGDFFFWEPDRDSRFVEIVEPPYSDDGLPIESLTRPVIQRGQLIHLIVHRKGEIPDFIHDLGMRFLVSQRVWKIIRGYRVFQVDAHEADLRDESGVLLDRVYWVIPVERVELMDRRESHYRMGPGETYREISYFAVKSDAKSRNDIFVCDETGMIVLTAPLTQAIRDSGATGARLSAVHASSWP